MSTPSPTAADWCAWARREREQGRGGRAVEGFRRALAIDPSSRAACFDLTSLLLDLGDVDGAATLTEPTDERPGMLWLCARVAAARRNPAETRDLLLRLLDRPEPTVPQRAEALLLLGLALGDLGEEAAAFAAAAQGKAMQRALYAAVADERESEVAKLRRVAARIASDPGDRLAPVEVPGAARVHVFLLGFPRSGTTLLEQVLAAHPGMRTLEEEPLLAAAYQAFLSDADACTRLTGLSGQEAAAWAADYWRRVRERGVDPAGTLFVDKQPAGTVDLPIIARLFPHARILFARRDPRDVVLSCFRQAFRMNAMTYAFTDLAETAACYDACMTLAQTARDRLPLAWTDVKHEALVEDFNGELARILAFLGLGPHPAMADFAAAAGARIIRTPSAAQVRAGLNRRGLGQWRRYEAELRPVLPVLAPWVDRLGYLA